MRSWERSIVTATVFTAALAVLASTSVASAAGPGSLCNTLSVCSGVTPLVSTVNNQHYDVMPGQTVTSKIIGATDLTGAETCSAGSIGCAGGGCAGVDVIVKSTPLGNTTICGSLSGCPASCTITFSYTAPNTPPNCACETSIVAYNASGNNSNNDVIDDGALNGSGTQPGGYAFVDAQGNPINTCGCGTTTTTNSTSTSTTSSTSRTTSSSTSTSTTASTTSTTASTTSTTASTTSTTESTTSTTESTTSTTESTTSTTEPTTSTTESTTSTTEPTTSTTESTTSTTEPTTSTTESTTSTSETSTSVTTVPTTTSTSTTLVHFQCYEVDGERSLGLRGVGVVDRFGSGTVDVHSPKRLCNPADKNGEAPDAPSSPEHLMGYTIVQKPPFLPRRGQVVINQFGTITVDLIRPSLLLVPSAKSTTAPPPPLANPAVDHYKCYTIRQSHGATRFTPVSGVSVRDQFGTITVTLKRPYRFCAPVDKNGEGIHDPTTNLTCYKVKALPKFEQSTTIFVNTQFGPVDLGKVTHANELCVPSTAP